MDPKEFELRSMAMAGGVEMILGMMLAAIGTVEQMNGTPDDVSESAMHMALCASLAKLIAHRMVDSNDVETRKQFIDHTAEQLKEFVGRCFELRDEINKEIISRNEFSKADPSKVVDDVLAEIGKKRGTGTAAGGVPLQPKPDEKPADPAATSDQKPEQKKED